MLLAEMIHRIWGEDRHGRRSTLLPRHTSPLLYAHMDLSSSVVQAETPVQIGWQALAPALIFTLLATLAVMLRWYTRSRISRILAHEDWLILFALILSIAMTGVIGGEVRVAWSMVGHRWNEQEENVSKLAKLVLCSNLLYQILINATKSSFLLQYLRLFQPRWIQWLCKFLLIVLLGAALYGFFGAIFMCSPVHKYWQPRTPGHCMNSEVYWIANASIGILMDFIIWFLPMPLVKGLRLPLRQKLSLIAVFALGGFVCIVSVLRLALVHIFATRDEMGRAGISAIVWSTIESNVGIICASLMVMKPLVVKVFPRLLDSRRPSRGNLYLPTISDNVSWRWGSTTDAMCAASRSTSMTRPPKDPQKILVTKKSMVEEDVWTRNDSGVQPPPTALFRDFGV